MKVIVTALFLIITAIGAAGQNNNEKRLSAIDAEISTAKTNENYGYADTLSQEKTLRLEILEAVNNDDFEKAKILKVKIDKLYDKNSQSEISIEHHNEISNENPVSKLFKKHISTPSSLRSGPYIVGTSSFRIYQGHDPSFGFGYSIGMIKYFRNENKKQIFGLNARTTLSYFIFSETGYVDLIQIGPHLAIPLTKNSAFEYGFLSGLSFVDSDPSFNMSTLINMRISGFSIGMDCNLNPVKHYYYYDYQSQKYYISCRFGINVGYKF